MGSRCVSSRCTRCGKNKRPIEDIASMEDLELREIFDGLWSPLESMQTKRPSRPVRSDSADGSRGVVLVELVATTAESSNPPARPLKKTKTGPPVAAKRSIRRRSNLSSTRFLQNFVKGMAAAFGGGLVPNTERTTYARPRVENLEGHGAGKSVSLTEKASSSRAGRRVFTSRLRSRSKTVPAERRPLTAEWYESLTAPYTPLQSTFQLQTYW